MNEYQAYQSFWASFGIPAYDESTVKEDTNLPYITYNVLSASFDETVYPSASIWYRGTSWESITEKEKQIEDYIGRGGVVVPFENGAIWIKRSSPFAQRMSDPDDLIRRIYLNLEVEFWKE